MGLDHRLTEAGNPATARLDRASTSEIVRLIVEEDRNVAPAVAAESEPLARLIDEVVRRIRLGGRLIYVGAGSSGRLGVLDAAECPPTFGTDPALVRGVIAGGDAALTASQEGAEDDEAAARSAIAALGVTREDFVLGIAASGTTPFVLAALVEAKRRGAGTGGVSCTPPEDLLRHADLVITPIVGPEVVAGSTRLKAGTATKLVLNTLTTAVMVRLGKVYRNLMVDLQAKSRKLAGRSVRIVREACGIDERRAKELVVAAGGSSKTAIAMHELGASRAMAERVLDECEGFLGEAIERFSDRSPLYYAGYSAAFEAEDVARLVARLRGAPERLREAVENEAPADRRSVRWRAPEHVAHLIECETAVFRSRVERIIAEDEPRFADWDPSPVPPEVGEVEDLLGRFAAERSATIGLIAPLDRAGWSRSASIGDEQVSLYQFLRGVAHHDEAHAIRISERIHPSLLDPAGG